MPENALELVVRLAKEGWHLECGPHVNFPGYWAWFYQHSDDLCCNECGGIIDQGWDNMSHALTLTDAILMAAHRATGTDYGVPHTNRQPEYFR